MMIQLQSVKRKVFKGERLKEKEEDIGTMINCMRDEGKKPTDNCNRIYLVSQHIGDWFISWFNEDSLICPEFMGELVVLPPIIFHYNHPMRYILFEVYTEGLGEVKVSWDSCFIFRISILDTTHVVSERTFCGTKSKYAYNKQYWVSKRLQC